MVEWANLVKSRGHFLLLVSSDKAGSKIGGEGETNGTQSPSYEKEKK